MNAITRVYNSRAIRLPQVSRTHREPWSWRVTLLIVLLIFSAFAVVYVKDLNRRMFIEYQDMTRSNQQAQVEWGKLMLEQSTLAAQGNIEQIASSRLRMYSPSAQELVLVSN